MGLLATVATVGGTDIERALCLLDPDLFCDHPGWVSMRIALFACSVKIMDLIT